MASHVYIMEWKDWRMAIMGQERTCWPRILQSRKWFILIQCLTELSAACDHLLSSNIFCIAHFLNARQWKIVSIIHNSEIYYKVTLRKYKTQLEACFPLNAIYKLCKKKTLHHILVWRESCFGTFSLINWWQLNVKKFVTYVHVWSVWKCVIFHE